MIGKLAQLFGLGRPAAVAREDAVQQPPAAVAAAVLADPSRVPAVAARLAPAELPAVLAALSGQPGSAAADLAAAVLSGRSQASPELLQRVAAELSPVQRERVLDALPAAVRAQALAHGFDPMAGIDAGPSSGADRARVAAQGQAIPPHLQEFAANNDLPARLADVRAGRSAVSVAERADLREALGQLDQAQLKSLRELLVEKPPHPQLRQMRDHAALKGPPTARGVLAILIGEPLGLAPKASPELIERAKSALEAYPYGFTPEVERRWIDALAQSPMAIRLVANNGPVGLEAVSKLGIANLEAAGHPWAEGQTLMRFGEAVPGRFDALRAFADKHGSDAFGDALVVLGKASQLDGLVLAIGRRDGFEAAVIAARAVAQDPHGLRCMRHRLGSDEAVMAALHGKSTAAVARQLAEHGATIKAFGDGGVALELGAQWPAPRARTPSIQRAEAQVLASVGLGPQALADRSRLSEAQLGDVSRAMKAEIARRAPDQAAALERELLGRRFVARRYYDELYAAGVKNPEHRYSVPTFESWRAADALVRDAAVRSRGRPLAPGELTQVMQAAHRQAGAGMVGRLEQSHLEDEDLGRLRSRAKDHVQLGNGFVEVDAATAALLDKNPYLTPHAVRPLADEAGNVHRPIIFAPGVDVPRMVADLDQWVRAHEGKLSPTELAAEVHFRLVSIHPFMDGNGRTAKLMADFVLERAGAEPPLWRKGDVLKNVERWPQAAREGVEFELEVVKRHFDAVVDARARPEAR